MVTKVSCLKAKNSEIISSLYMTASPCNSAIQSHNSQVRRRYCEIRIVLKISQVVVTRSSFARPRIRLDRPNVCQWTWLAPQPEQGYKPRQREVSPLSKDRSESARPISHDYKATTLRSRRARISAEREDLAVHCSLYCPWDGSNIAAP